MEYSCNQTLLDLWTIEYIDIFVKDTSVDFTSTLATVKANILALAPNFDVDTLVETKQAEGCPNTSYFGGLL